MHGIDRHEHRGSPIASAATPPTAALEWRLMMDVGIVEHDLAPSAQRAPAVGLAFHEAIEHAALEVFRDRGRSGSSTPASRIES